MKTLKLELCELKTKVDELEKLLSEFSENKTNGIEKETITVKATKSESVEIEGKTLDEIVRENSVEQKEVYKCDKCDNMLRIHKDRLHSNSTKQGCMYRELKSGENGADIFTYECNLCGIQFNEKTWVHLEKQHAYLEDRIHRLCFYKKY